ncbi:MAG: DUF6166 domain-containing protein [Phycisphaerae bacterium]
MVIYFGRKRDGGVGGQTVRIKHPNGNTTFLRHALVWHSPDGFNWGYGGSGPADLALNILYDYFRRIKLKKAKQTAIALYQRFKWDVVSGLPDNFELQGSEIEAWLKNQELDV